jgi:glutathione S-transferase/GST-like protein
MDESGRRIALGVQQLEAALGERSWVAGNTFSMADIAGFNMLAGLPMMNPQVANDAVTPQLMEWLRKINERPATRRIFALGRTDLMRRYVHLERKSA